MSWLGSVARSYFKNLVLECTFESSYCNIHPMFSMAYCMAQMFDGGNFDESKLHHQNFPYQYFTFQ